MMRKDLWGYAPEEGMTAAEMHKIQYQVRAGVGAGVDVSPSYSTERNFYDFSLYKWNMLKQWIKHVSIVKV